MSKFKRVRYYTGILSVVIFVAAVLLLPLPSALRWQSDFLGRSLLWLLGVLFLCLSRILIGPGAANRAAAINMLGILIVGFCAILSIATGRDWYMDIGIAWALQSFIGIVAISKYLEGKDFDE